MHTFLVILGIFFSLQILWVIIIFFWIYGSLLLDEGKALRILNKTKDTYPRGGTKYQGIDIRWEDNLVNEKSLKSLFKSIDRIPKDKLEKYPIKNIFITKTYEGLKDLRTYGRVRDNDIFIGMFWACDLIRGHTVFPYHAMIHEFIHIVQNYEKDTSFVERYALDNGWQYDVMEELWKHENPIDDFNGFSSSYSLTGPKEDMAETFAFYITGDTERMSEQRKISAKAFWNI